MKRMVIFVVVFVFMLSSFLFFNCAQQTMVSHWADESLAIDGKTDEWSAALSYDEKLDASYGIQNDGDHLYVAFATSNQSLQHQLLMQGLVLWINDTGDHTKDLGFKFPRGLMERGVPARGIMTALQNRDGSFSEEQIQSALYQNFRDLQVLDSKGNNLAIYTHKDADEHGIQFNLSLSKEILSYELSIPLEESGRFPWNFVNVSTLGIGFETPEFDRSHMGGRPMGGGMMDASSGGGSTGGGGRGGRGGGMRGGGMPEEMPDSMPSSPRGQQNDIKVWMSASMAKK